MVENEETNPVAALPNKVALASRLASRSRTTADLDVCATSVEW